LEQVRRQLDRILNLQGSPQSPAPEFPAANVYDGDDCAPILISVPGVMPEDIDVTIVDDTVTVKCARRPADPAGGGNYLRHEREAAEFVRTIRLPFEADPELVSARLSRGLLVVKIAKPATDHRRRVAVKQP
jgi:HSP20 family protein